MVYQPRTSCLKCQGAARPGTNALMSYLVARFPQARNLGIYSCRKIAGTNALSVHACGRAGDTGIPMLSNGRANTTLGNPVVQFIDRYSTQFGIIVQIYNRVIYDARSPRGRVYTGVNPHYDHIHWEQTPSAATNLTYAAIVAIVQGSPSPPPPSPPPSPINPPTMEDDDMTIEQWMSQMTVARVTAICNSKIGGSWVINPESGDRVNTTNYWVNLFNQNRSFNPPKWDTAAWEAFRRAVIMSGQVGAALHQ